MKIKEMIENSKKVVISEIMEVLQEEVKLFAEESTTSLEILYKNILGNELDSELETLVISRFLEDLENQIKYRLNNVKLRI